MEKPQKNVVNAGLIFMFSVWLQGQMSDLIIFKKNPHLVEDFVNNATQVTDAFHQVRVKYWEKQFGSVKTEFIEVFSDDLSEHEKQDLDEIYYVRNMIAHSHVSMGRDYMLYRPAGERKEREVIEALRPEPLHDKSNPVLLVIEFWRDDVFNSLSEKIRKIDQVCFARLAAMLNVPHGHIR